MARTSGVVHSCLIPSQVCDPLHCPPILNPRTAPGYFKGEGGVHAWQEKGKHKQVPSWFAAGSRQVASKSATCRRHVADSQRVRDRVRDQVRSTFARSTFAASSRNGNRPLPLSIFTHRNCGHSLLANNLLVLYTCTRKLSLHSSYYRCILLVYRQPTLSLRALGLCLHTWSAQNS